MELNADFTKRAVVHGAMMPWQASPIPGVERKMLDRIGDEVARATTIVRYAPNSQFSPHIHGGGEEFLVLAGVFQDEHGDYPVGTYVRNPPTSRHTPGSVSGCTILVKLWQFDLDDFPSETVEDLKKVAPLLGFSGYQPLIRAYIGQCLRVDLERFESETVTALVASLKRRGVSDAVIDEALSEVVHAESH